MFKTITERIQATATAKTIYGDPVTANGKTLIPVAKVRFGFGAGGGSGYRDGESDETMGHGEGRGGGVEVSPVGVLEVTDEATTFVRIQSRRMVMAAFIFGLFLGRAIFGRRGRQAKDS